MTADRPRRLRALAPRVVALGGGHGLASSLRAAQLYSSSIVGIVSVADDGGSSGRLRRELGLPAPGDLRRCLSALASDDSLLARSLEHRFDSGPLEGHPLGNLLIAGLASAGADFQAAITEVARLIGAVGTIYPATQESLTLEADSDLGPIRGQVTIERATGIRNLRFDPADPKSPPEAVAAILAADQIIIGPGSLFTSVLATAVVPQILDALIETRAERVFVANVANDRAEAHGFDLAAHIRALEAHRVPIDIVLASGGVDDDGELGEMSGVGGVVADLPVVFADIAADDGWGHRPDKLAAALSELHATTHR